MGVSPKAGGGGSMPLIIVSIIVVAGGVIYIIDPYGFQSIVSTIAHWLHFSR